MLGVTKVLSRLDVPYVYFAFSHQANRWAGEVGQHYVGKIGSAGGNPEAALDRPGALNQGFHRGRREQPRSSWLKTSDPLLGARDWDLAITAMFDDRPWAERVEEDVRAAWRGRGMGDFDEEPARALLRPGMNPNGLSEIVRISPSWLSANEEEYGALVDASGGDPLAADVLNGVRSFMHDLVVSILPEIGVAQAPMIEVPTFIGSLVEDPEGAVRMQDAGPRLSPTAPERPDD